MKRTPSVPLSAFSKQQVRIYLRVGRQLLWDLTDTFIFSIKGSITPSAGRIGKSYFVLCRFPRSLGSVYIFLLSASFIAFSFLATSLSSSCLSVLHSASYDQLPSKHSALKSLSLRVLSTPTKGPSSLPECKSRSYFFNIQVNPEPYVIHDENGFHSLLKRVQVHLSLMIGICQSETHLRQPREKGSALRGRIMERGQRKRPAFLYTYTANFSSHSVHHPRIQVACGVSASFPELG